MVEYVGVARCHCCCRRLRTRVHIHDTQQCLSGNLKYKLLAGLGIGLGLPLGSNSHSEGSLC